MAAHFAERRTLVSGIGSREDLRGQLLTSRRLTQRCHDGNHDGVLDIIGRDTCLCNTKTWATEGDYTPKGLYEYYQIMGNTIYIAYYPEGNRWDTS